ncbi:MAG: GyrI-like domain-containing protein [Planctomycetota bacterium]|nr:GyrI-like domain-containing protein [Planctomycetota bacterium]
MEKLDLRKKLASLYKASAQEQALVEVPALDYLMVDGRGDPESSPAFQQAIEALYGISYTLKFGLKEREGMDWRVMGMEGLWWAAGKDPGEAFRSGDKARWQWTLLIAQPDFVTRAFVEEARTELLAHRKMPAAKLVRLERLDEGLSAQILHVGPYAEVRPTIDLMHAFIQEKGYEFAGKHHEIYLSDPRRTKPERLKTILRQPVKKVRKKR